MSRSRVALVTAQWVLLVAILFWAGRAVATQWAEVKAAVTTAQVEWSWVLLASALVLVTYGILIQSWRLLLDGWGGHLRFGVAVRIWTVANLGRYVPGKVWSVGALGVLANREGVSGVAAAGAAILGTLLNLGAGFGILAIGGTRALAAFNPWMKPVAVAVGVAFVVATIFLPRVLPVVLERVRRWRGLGAPERTLPARTLWIASGINAVSWILYGIAFALFARGVSPQVSGTLTEFIVIWTASYLLGYVVLVAPGGVVVREVAMASALITLGLAASTAEATFLAVASRLWLTVWELLPGLVSLMAAPRLPRPLDAPSE